MAGLLDMLPGLLFHPQTTFNDAPTDQELFRLRQKMLADRAATGIMTFDPGQHGFPDRNTQMPDDLMSYLNSGLRFENI